MNCYLHDKLIHVHHDEVVMTFIDENLICTSEFKF